MVEDSTSLSARQQRLGVPEVRSLVGCERQKTTSIHVGGIHGTVMHNEMAYRLGRAPDSGIKEGVLARF